jgi:hypothetical protein
MNEASFRMSNHTLSANYDYIMYCLQKETEVLKRPLTSSEAAVSIRKWTTAEDSAAIDDMIAEIALDKPKFILDIENE